MEIGYILPCRIFSSKKITPREDFNWIENGLKKQWNKKQSLFKVKKKDSVVSDVI